MIKNGDGSACTGNVTYNVEYGVFSSDGANRLDIGTLGAGSSQTTWDINSGDTRLHVNPVA